MITQVSGSTKLYLAHAILGSAAAFLLGSVSKQVVTKASCDVLVVKK